MNDVSLEYSGKTNVSSGDPTDTTETKKPTDLPAVYTYAIDLMKYGDSDTSNPLKDVTFELYRAGEAEGIDSAVKLNITKEQMGIITLTRLVSDVLNNGSGRAPVCEGTGTGNVLPEGNSDLTRDIICCHSLLRSKLHPMREVTQGMKPEPSHR